MPPLERYFSAKNTRDVKNVERGKKSNALLLFLLKNIFFAENGTTGAKFPLAPMGVLAPVSAHAGPSGQPPIDSAHVCRVDFTKFPHFPIKIGLIGDIGRIPQISFSFES